MTPILVAWLLSAAVLAGAGIWLGVVTRGSWLGILTDNRGRYSLTQLQLVLWTLVVLSLVAGVALGRLAGGVAGATLDFRIPQELLVVMGISVGSTATVAAIKASRNVTRQEAVSASDEHDRPRFLQVFLVEEGQYADQIVDVTKFQNFWITVVAVVAYVGLALAEIGTLGSPADLTSLPGFSDTMLVLIGISHAGYVAGKLPSPQGTPKGLTVALKLQGAVPDGKAAAAGAPTYVPRNP